MLKPGQRVKVKQNFFKIIDNKSTLPSSWKNDATLLKVELDKNLTEMSNKKRYRYIIEFDEEPCRPSEEDIQRFTEENCYIASLLPMMLTLTSP